MRFRYTFKKAMMLNFILIAIVPLALVGTISLRIFSRTIKEEISAKNIQLAKAVSGEVDRFLAESVRVLELANERVAFRRKKGETPPPDDFLNLLRGNLEIFNRIEITDQEGVVRHIAPPDPGRLNTDMSGQPLFHDARVTGHVAFGTFISPSAGLPPIAVVLSGKKGFSIGYLNLSALQAIVDNATVGKMAYIVICDRSGSIIAHSDHRLVNKNMKNIEPIRRAINGETGTFHYRFQGREEIGSTAITSKAGWIVLVCQLEEDAFAPVAKIRGMLFTSVALIAFIAFVLAVFILRKPLRSLAALVENAAKIAQGNYRFEVVNPSYPEFDLLAEGMMDMVRDIASRESVLKKTEERYRSLVEESFDGIFVHDCKVVIFANQCFCAMFGYEEKEIIGVDFASLLGEDYREMVFDRAVKRLEGKDVPRRYEVKMVRRDGSLFDVEVSAGKIVVDNKPAIQVWVRDISEQKKMDEKRAISERRFEELYNSVSDLVYTQDIEGRFLSVNRSMADLFGLTPDDLIGVKASDFMKPESVPLFESEYLGTLKKEGHYEGISSYYNSDKNKFYVEYRSVLVTPQYGEPFISGIGRDVTDKIIAQWQMRKSIDLMRAVLDTSPVSVVAYDVDGNVIFINKAFTDVFGWTIEELKGRPIPFVPEDQKERTIQPIIDLYSGKTTGVIKLETTRFTKKGDKLDIFVSAALIIGSDKKATGMVVSLMDMTERKKMEASVMQAQKMESIGVLAGGIAHDFNNLLMGIQGNVSISFLNKGLNDGLRKNLENIEALVNRGATLTRQLLGFARGGKYEVKTYDISDILEAEAELFGSTKKEIVIERTPAPGIWKVDVDRSQIEQVFMNLFVNAGQAMPNGGNLYLSAENVVIDNAYKVLFDVKPGRYVKVSVTDTGIGMDENTKKKIFEPFFTTKETGKGTGLGLASVYGIVKNHGGFINVYSEVGKGSSFNVYLPASESETAERKSSSKTEGEILQGKGTILLVDDEPMVLEVGREMLEMFGYRVLTAKNGREAIETYAAIKGGTGDVEQIDLVIQDMIMPGLKGGEVFDRLKEIDPGVKILLSSGYSIDGQAEEILSRGCSGFIQKPFTMVELSRKVWEIIRREA